MNLITYDFEAYDWIKLYAVGFYDGIKTQTKVHKKISKNSNSQLIKWLLDNIPDKSTAFAHFGGKYDIRFIVDYLSDKTYNVANWQATKIVMIRSALASLTIKNTDGKTLTFRDSYLLLPQSLDKLTISFNVCNKKLKLDYSLGVKDVNFKSYFENDLIGLYQVLRQSKLKLELLTLAGNAMHTFKSMYGKKMLPNKTSIDDVFRESYFGGRTEIFKKCFKSKNKTLKYYDINSLYPSVMVNTQYPVFMTNNFIKTQSLVENGIYQVKVSVPENLNIPLLPYHIDKKLMFSTGNFTGSYTGVELLKAIELGYDIDILTGYAFTTDDIFSDYVNFFYSMRGNDKALNLIAKLFLNSLYGKIGQKRLIEIYKLTEAKKLTKPFYIGNKIFDVAELNAVSGFKHSEIASLVTSRARLKLYSYIEQCEDDIYYCDTDSVLTTKDLATDNKLGGIKLEYELCEAYFLAPKFYALKTVDGKEIVKVKGFRDSQIKFSDVKNAYLTNDYSNLINTGSQFVSIRDSLKNSTELTVRDDFTSRFLGLQDKRIYNTKNNTSIPIQINIP